MKSALARLEFFPGTLLAQAKTQVEDNSYLNIDRNQIAWPSPESVLADLRSSNDDVRLKALRLVGLTDQQSHRAVWVSVNGGPAKVIREAVARPERVQLTYATIGEDRSEVAIVAFDLRSLEATYAAVAIREGRRWQHRQPY